MEIVSNPEDPFPIRPELIADIRAKADRHIVPSEAHKAVDWSIVNLVRVAPYDHELHELYLGALASKFTQQQTSTRT